MSIISGLTSGLGSLVAGSVGSLFGSSGNPYEGISHNISKMAEDQGIKSMMQGSNAPPPAKDVKTDISGSSADDLMKQMGAEAFKTGAQSVASKGVGSLLNDTSSPSQLGRDNRATLDASFPELNAWEKAGATATQAGIQAGNMKQESQLRREKFNQDYALQQAQLDTQTKIAGLNAAVSRLNNKDSLSPANKMLQHKLDQIAAQTADTKKQTLLRGKTNTWLGKGATDLQSWANEFTKNHGNDHGIESQTKNTKPELRKTNTYLQGLGIPDAKLINLDKIPPILKIKHKGKTYAEDNDKASMFDHVADAIFN